MAATRLLIKYGASVSAVNSYRWTPLHMACRTGALEPVRMLLTHDVDIHTRGNEDMTALHWACFGDHLEIVRVVMRHGANAMAVDDKGQTHLARCHLEVCK